MITFYYKEYAILTHFKSSSIPLLKGRQTPLSNSRNCKGHKKRDRLLVSKSSFSLRNKKNLLIDPVFSNGVYLIKNVSIIKYSRNSKMYRHLFLPIKL